MGTEFFFLPGGLSSGGPRGVNASDDERKIVSFLENKKNFRSLGFWRKSVVSVCCFPFGLNWPKFFPFVGLFLNWGQKKGATKKCPSGQTSISPS